MTCPHCQYDNLEGVRFCGECAKPLSREHISPVYRRKALELLAQEFLSVVKKRQPTL